MKPNIKFLQKVDRGEVRRHCGYNARTGQTDNFYGGQATAQKHADAGYIVMPGYPGVMRSSVATLTDAGRAALAQSST